MVNKRKGIWTCLVVSFILSVALSSMSLTRFAGAQPTGATFKIEPEGSVARLGETFTVAAMAYDIPEADPFGNLALWGWQIDLYWEPTILSYVSHTFGDILAEMPDGTSQVADTYFVDDGILTIGETTMGGYVGVSGDGWMCSATFEVLSLTADIMNITNIWTYYIDKNQNYYGDDAEPVSAELSKEDGHFTPPWPEDINVDGIIDIFDIAYVGIDYGACGVQTKNPSSCTGGWTTPTEAYSSDDVYAGVPKNGEEEYSSYGFSTSGWTGVSKVEVGVEGYSEGGEIIRISVSGNGGSSYSTTTHDVVLTGSDTFTWVDVTSDLAWTPGMLSDGSFMVKAVGIAVGGYKNTFVDWLPARVEPLPQAYSPYTDINGDGVVDIIDLSMVAMKFGEEYG